MNTEKHTGSKKNGKDQFGSGRNKFEEEFRSLPLEDKFKSLFRMEAATLEETVSYVADASMKAFEKAGAVLTDFGKRVENEVKKATASGKTAGASKTGASAPNASEKKKTTASRKQPPKKSSSN